MATDRKVNVKVDADVGPFVAGMLKARAAMKGLTDDINTSSDRTAWLAQSILGLGPAFVPIGATAVPIVAGLTAELLAAGTATGIAIYAFQGVGDGLKALNDYQLKPTTENLAKMQEAMAKLGPDGEHFVRFLDRAGESLAPLQNLARAGIFPGVEEGITSLMTLLPKVTVIVREMSGAMGEIAADAGSNLAGPKFTAFFDYLETDGRPILEATARTAGNFVEGMANMVVAFKPLTDSFVGGFENMSESFAEWSRGLDDSESFQNFLQYIEENGPRVEALFEALGKALVSILEAAAPIGALLVPALTQLLNVISAIAQTPFGPLLVGLASLVSLYGRFKALQSVTTGGAFGKLTSGLRGSTKGALSGITADLGAIAATMTTAGARTERESKRMKESLGRLGKAGGAAAAGLAVVGAAGSGLTDKLHLTNTAMGALLGTMIAPGVGTAIGALAGGVADFVSVARDAEAAEDAWTRALTRRSTAELMAQRARLQGEKATAGKQTPAAQLVNTGAGYGAAKQPEITFAAGDERKLAAINKELEMRSARVGAANLALISDGTHLTAAGMQTAAQSADDLNRSLAQLEQALTGRASMRDYQAAIDDVRASIKENGKSLDINTAKGRANQAALDGIASTAVNVAKGLQGIDKIKFLDGARNDLIAAARQFGLTRRQAAALADKLLGVDKIKARPTIEVRKQKAESALAQMRARLKELGNQRPTPKVNAEINALKQKIREAQAVLDGLRDKTVDVTVHYMTIGNKPKVFPGGELKADGGPVYGPGGPRDDMVPHWLSNGEFVVNSKAYAKFKQEIEWMNAQGLASGGSVGAARQTTMHTTSLEGSRIIISAPGLPDIVGTVARHEARGAVADELEMAGTRQRAGAR